jgi:hypothetical protein
MSFDKMATVRTGQSISGSNFNDICDIKETNQYVCGYKLSGDLEITVQGLSSVTKIIQLLQEDVNFKPDLGAVSIMETNSIHYLNFEMSEY